MCYFCQAHSPMSLLDITAVALFISKFLVNAYEPPIFLSCAGETKTLIWPNHSSEKLQTWFHAGRPLAKKTGDGLEILENRFEGRLSQSDVKFTNVVIKNVTVTDSGIYEWSDAWGNILEVKLQVFTAHDLEPTVQINQRRIIVSKEDDAYDFTGVSNIFLVVVTTDGLPANITIDDTKKRVSCEKVTVCPTHLSTNRGVSSMNVMISLHYEMCDVLKYELPFPSRGKLLSHPGRLRACVGQNVSLNWNFTSGFVNELVMQDKTMSWYLKKSTNALLGTKTIRNDTFKSSTYILDLYKYLHIGPLRDSNGGIMIYNVSTQDVGKYKVETGSADEFPVALLEVYEEGALRPKEFIDGKPVECKRNQEYDVTCRNHIHMTLATVHRLRADFSIEFNGTEVKQCTHQRYCVVVLDLTGATGTDRVIGWIKVDYHVCIVQEYRFILTKGDYGQCSSAVEMFPKDELERNITDLQAPISIPWVGIRRPDIGPDYTSSWLVSPGRFDACENETIALPWHFDANMTSENWRIFWMHIDSNASMMAYYTKQHRAIANQNYMARIGQLTGVNAGIFLTNVTRPDSGRYRIILEAHLHSQTDVAFVNIHTFDELRPKLLVDEEKVHFGQTIDRSDQRYFNLSIEVVKKLKVNIEIKVNDESYKICNRSCFVRLNFGSFNTTSISVWISAEYKMCGIHEGSLEIHTGNQRGGESFLDEHGIVIVTVLVCLFIPLSLVGLGIWIWRTPSGKRFRQYFCEYFLVPNQPKDEVK